MMDTISENLAGTLNYIGPRKWLLVSQLFQAASEQPNLPKAFQTWRTRKLKNTQLFPHQAALFCFGRKCMAVEDDWSFTFWPDENSLIDIVFRQRKPSGEIIFEFVQLKEVVPENIVSNHSLQSVLDDLPKKYPTTGGVTIGIHLNRNAVTELSSLRLPKLKGGNIWLFGQGGKSPHDSFLVGDLLNTPVFCYFNRPNFLPGESVTRWKTALDDELLTNSIT